MLPTKRSLLWPLVAALVFAATPPGAQEGDDLLDLFEALPEQPSVREGTYDIDRNKRPDYWNAWLDRFEERAGTLWEQGYPKPQETNLLHYNSTTLQHLEMKLSKIDDPCEQAVLAKLYLDANQDDVMPAAKLGLDILTTIVVPNHFDISKGAKDLLVDPTKGLSELKVASKVHNAVNIGQALNAFARGEMEGQKAAQLGRWALNVYEKARSEAWDPGRIKQERKERLARNEELQNEIQALLAEMDERARKHEKQYEARIEEIDRQLDKDLQAIRAGRAASDEEKRRLERLRDPDFVVPGTLGYQPGVDVKGRPSIEEMRQRYLADAQNQYERARAGAELLAQSLRMKEMASLEVELRILGKQIQEKMAKRLGQMARMHAEEQALKEFSAPVLAGDCEKLRDGYVDPVSTVARLPYGKLNIFLDHIGARPSGSFYDCLCREARYGSPQTRQFFHPGSLEDSSPACERPGPPCVVAGWGCGRHPLPSGAGIWQTCAERTGEGIPDAIEAAVEARGAEGP
ncbi:hypothetical protein [Roseovarius salinarum]|uniref:hypothetical protein n=1 Tax=Roseovarius salinarum TaxID=1981892 RepID=UPI0018E49DED|nr:hypothetical protein [Roseovarius salinarum]